MINKSLENRIIYLIPSKTVKTEIHKLHFHFSEIDLVKIIIEFGPYFDVRMELLEQLKDYIIQKDVKKYIKRLIINQQKEYELLISEDNNYVYEVSMEPYSIYEKYLCPNFEAALITADSYRRRYKAQPEEFKITKRKVATRRRANNVDSGDDPVEAYLDKNSKIKKIYSEIQPAKFEDLDIVMDAIHYPEIFKKGDLVSYSNLYTKYSINDGIESHVYQFNGETVYGINSFDNIKSYSDNQTVFDESCFLFLKCTYVEKREVDIKDEYGYYPYLMQHDHIGFGYLEKVDINTIDEKVKLDYEYVLNELNRGIW
jgi:hypothetical protein